MNNARGRVASVESGDGAWWICARGGEGAGICDEDARAVSGPVVLDTTPYPRRYVGYGAICDVVLPGEIVGRDEASDSPILSAAAVERLAEVSR